MRAILARIRKRWRVIRAAVTQQWHQHRCVDCGLDWWCEGDGCRHYSPGERCIVCEHLQFEKLIGNRILPAPWSGRAS